ncbi:Cysteine proteinase inhibitor 4 like [Actinidia chinensis var. chinensis]|uniref:Cysteine proteinase inhibitor 4 like n=1 Tax=Actinidia chinensis var. chinensis TaxID=1590841 RepID=A0A2R6S047_ACTCC|nr:Cysteine proteinase inhibitor 4 like [Actinidia chinensis var. chinensis]
MDKHHKTLFSRERERERERPSFSSNAALRSCCHLITCPNTTLALPRYIHTLKYSTIFVSGHLHDTYITQVTGDHGQAHPHGGGIGRRGVLFDGGGRDGRREDEGKGREIERGGSGIREILGGAVQQAEEEQRRRSEV